MPNVDNNEMEVIEEVKVLNPLDRYRYSEDEFAAYLKDNAIPGEDPATRPRIVDYQKDIDKPDIIAFKSLVFAWKNAGKTHLIRTMHGLNRQNPEINKLEYNHVKWLLVKKFLMEITQGECLDSEGQGDAAKSKFAGIPFRNRAMFYENGPMPLMQDPVAYMREWALFMKSCQWAYSHPDIYKSKTELNAPDAVAFENLTIFGNEIMDYVRTVSHDKKAEKLAAKGQELGAPLEPKFDNFDIRNRNWDYTGGFIQNKLEPHFLATCRARKKWVNSEPTDTDDIAVYSQASASFNIVVFLWREDNEQTRTRRFFAQVVSSHWMEPGTMYPVIENPTYLKIMAQITKYSHRFLLDKNGTWKKYKYKNGIEFEAWIENKTEKPVIQPETTIKEVPAGKVAAPTVEKKKRAPKKKEMDASASPPSTTPKNSHPVEKVSPPVEPVSTTRVQDVGKDGDEKASDKNGKIEEIEE